ncbi:MAG: hypothetical protein LBN06_11615 [Prevotellaceae bacterium]|jgi:hypothetical protein|nr:hypothetical protein [Prevotellaceae bacterium]
MMGFSETEVREMFQYYQEAGTLRGDIDAMIEEKGDGDRELPQLALLFL